MSSGSLPGPAAGSASASLSQHPPQHQQQQHPPPQQPVVNGIIPQPTAPLIMPARDWRGMTRTIAHYERLEQIGEGTYGQVYKARCKDTDQIVAMKKIRVHHGKDWGMPPTVIREIKILKRLQHPNLVKMMEVVSSKGVEDLDEEDESTDVRFQKKSKDRVLDGREGYKGNLFLVLEYVSHDLTGLMDIAYQFTPVQVKSIFKQLLEALDYMHQNKYVHRDIKSSNILLDHHFRVKLADFGLARCIEPPILDNLHDRASSQEFTNKVITLWYRPPEILLGATRYGPPVDVWSAGCILAELLIGKPLFTGKTEMDQLQLIFDLLGTPSPDTWDGLTDLKLLRTGQVALPPEEKRKDPRLRPKYSRKMNAVEMNLVEKLLELDPAKRLTAERALSNRYFLVEPIAPDRPEDLGPIQVKDHFHEFQTKRKRRQAKAEAEKSREAAKAAGMDDEQAQEQFDTCYRKLMARVAAEGIDAFGASTPPKRDKRGSSSGATSSRNRDKESSRKEHRDRDRDRSSKNDPFSNSNPRDDNRRESKKSDRSHRDRDRTEEDRRSKKEGSENRKRDGEHRRRDPEETTEQRSRRKEEERMRKEIDKVGDLEDRKRRKELDRMAKLKEKESTKERRPSMEEGEEKPEGEKRESNSRKDRDRPSREHRSSRDSGDRRDKDRSSRSSSRRESDRSRRDRDRDPDDESRSKKRRRRDSEDDERHKSGGGDSTHRSRSGAGSEKDRVKGRKETSEEGAVGAFVGGDNHRDDRRPPKDDGKPRDTARKERDDRDRDRGSKLSRERDRTSRKDRGPGGDGADRRGRHDERRKHEDSGSSRRSGHGGGGGGDDMGRGDPKRRDRDRDGDDRGRHHHGGGGRDHLGGGGGRGGPWNNGPPPPMDFPPPGPPHRGGGGAGGGPRGGGPPAGHYGPGGGGGGGPPPMDFPPGGGPGGPPFRGGGRDDRDGGGGPRGGGDRDNNRRSPGRRRGNDNRGDHGPPGGGHRGGNNNNNKDRR